MRRSTRIGICLCWCLATAIALTWAISLWRGQLMVDGQTTKFTLQLADGIVAAAWPSSSRATPSPATIQTDTFYIIPSGITGPPTYGLILPSIGDSAFIAKPLVSFVFVPLWLPLLLTLMPIATIAIRKRRRIPPGHCPRCRYNLTGNTSGVCPECGLPVPPAQPTSVRLAS